MTARLDGLADEARALLGSDGWLVGGAVRDHLLGRPVEDWDVVVAGDPGAAARAHARRAGGSPFPLSERHGEPFSRSLSRSPRARRRPRSHSVLRRPRGQV